MRSNRADNRLADVKWYIMDNGDTGSIFNLMPGEKPENIQSDIYIWLSENALNFPSLFTRE
jgi:hypothetical protein